MSYDLTRWSSPAARKRADVERIDVMISSLLLALTPPNAKSGGVKETASYLKIVFSHTRHHPQKVFCETERGRTIVDS